MLPINFRLIAKGVIPDPELTIQRLKRLKLYTKQCHENIYFFNLLFFQNNNNIRYARDLSVSKLNFRLKRIRISLKFSSKICPTPTTGHVK